LVSIVRNGAQTADYGCSGHSGVLEGTDGDWVGSGSSGLRLLRRRVSEDIDSSARETRVGAPPLRRCRYRPSLAKPTPMTGSNSESTSQRRNGELSRANITMAFLQKVDVQPRWKTRDGAPMKLGVTVLLAAAGE